VTIYCRYNGVLPSGDKGRRKSKFTLYKKAAANGVKPVKHHLVKNPQLSEVLSWSIVDWLISYAYEHLSLTYAPSAVYIFSMEDLLLYIGCFHWMCMNICRSRTTKFCSVQHEKLLPTSILIWRPSLLAHLRQTTSIDLFKRSLKTFLFGQISRPVL